MKKMFLIVISSVFLFSGCFNSSKGDEKEKVTLVLDWLPNTNHTGIFVAKEKGFYDEFNINLEILNPPEDSVEFLIAANKADFGISFQDSIGRILNEDESLDLLAVASIIQHNTSGLLSLKEKGIDSFEKLEGKTYATWGQPLEQAIIKQVMENNGGDFEKVKLYYSTITDAVTAMSTNVDSVWVFEAWDTMMAKVLGIDYNFLKFADTEEALDFYTPVIISSKAFLEENSDLAKKFLGATKRGYEYTIENHEEAAEILHKYAPEYDINLLKESQKFLANEYKAEVEKWGYIDPKRWNNFFKWAYDKGIFQKDLINKGFTNEFLH